MAKKPNRSRTEKPAKAAKLTKSVPPADPQPQAGEAPAVRPLVPGVR